MSCKENRGLNIVIEVLFIVANGSILIMAIQSFTMDLQSFHVIDKVIETVTAPLCNRRSIIESGRN